MGTKDKGRRVYSKEFKVEAAAPAGKHENPVRQAAADLGVNENVLHRWIPQAREAGNNVDTTIERSLKTPSKSYLIIGSHSQ
jgi:transposase-like protein